PPPARVATPPAPWPSRRPHRSSFAICSNSRSRRPMGEEENFPPCKALKSLKMRKSLPDSPRRDSPPLTLLPKPEPPRRGRATPSARVSRNGFLDVAVELSPSVFLPTGV